MSPIMRGLSAVELAHSVTSGDRSALEIVDDALARIANLDPKLNAFTQVTAERARTKAKAVDRNRSNGSWVGPLAGVPFAVKNLFDVQGLRTLAGSKINQRYAAASRDAALVERLEAAGAILVGTLNMSEYAYDFTGDNVHFGPTRNPHDRDRLAGGSSSGSGSAVGGGLVPIALGSDTNGSIRVPSSFCGIFGLKPTYGRLSRARTFPFVSSLDHLGPFARNLRDLAATYDAMRGYDADDPVCADRDAPALTPQLSRGIDGLRIAVAGGFFTRGLSREAKAALERVAEALKVTREILLPGAERARSAAYVITASEGSALHLERLASHGTEFDPAIRDRLIAGAMLPASIYNQAQRFRRQFMQEVFGSFEKVDVILAPATPCVAPKIGQQTLQLEEVEIPLRPNIGLYTQPISFIGLPVVAVPIPGKELPIGVQIIAAPWREDIAMRVAAHLEMSGVASAPDPLQ
jgi:aspartyl-tRNA(Asn)/glutamyl-tRNA(Gln) amidotransferase subunit A